MSRFIIGDRVEAMHNRCEPTGAFGTVVSVREVFGHGALLTVTSDDATHESLPMWEHESYFRLIEEASQ